LVCSDFYGLLSGRSPSLADRLAYSLVELRQEAIRGYEPFKGVVGGEQSEAIGEKAIERRGNERGGPVFEPP
ncbi:MAG TPA: hypothetical protein VF762_10840, partial [Blastocatellia bacterium]